MSYRDRANAQRSYEQFAAETGSSIEDRREIARATGVTLAQDPVGEDGMGYHYREGITDLTAGKSIFRDPQGSLTNRSAPSKSSR